MSRITLGEARKTEHGICNVLGLCPEDDRVRHIINQSQAELNPKGRWWGTYQEVRVVVQSGAVVWPREVANIEAMRICGSPCPIENQWHKYLDFCFGNSWGCGVMPSEDRGTTCVFDEVKGANKTIRTFPGSLVDVGKKIRYQGYDQNEIWIRSMIDGIMQDGEQVVIATPFADTVSQFKSLVAVQKEETSARVLVYEHDTVLDTDRAIAVYEPSETAPHYRKFYISGGCCATQVQAIVKLEYIPAKLDSDWLLIGNLTALKKMALSIHARNNDQDLQATLLMKAAVKDLNDELFTHTGGRVAVNLTVQEASNMNRLMRGFI